MPRAQFMSDEDYKRYERCLDDLKNKKGINRYAICMASIKRKKKVKESMLKKL